MRQKGLADKSGSEWQRRGIQTSIANVLKRLNAPGDRQAQLAVAALLLLGEAVLCALIVLCIPCTSPDFHEHCNAIII